MNGNGVEKNYGGWMIFGDEKITPLRYGIYHMPRSLYANRNFRG